LCKRKPAYAVRFMFLNPLSQVGARRNGFEVPFRGHVSRVSISAPGKQSLVQNNEEPKRTSQDVVLL